jgi:hypothetical protein
MSAVILLPHWWVAAHCILTVLYITVCYQVISYDSSRGGVSVITEKGDVTTSYLLIQHAEVTDSGKYSCSPSNADVASVKVHVLNGKRLISILVQQTHCIVFKPRPILLSY